MQQNDIFDIIIIGAGPSGLIAAITATRNNKKVLLLEKSSKIATKLKASGGGRCNLTNTLSKDNFIASFGKNGRFIQNAIESFSYQELIDFLDSIGVDTHIPDGFRVFPTTHKSTTIIEALQQEIKRLDIRVLTNSKVKSIITQNSKAIGVKTVDKSYKAEHIVVATGGMGYPSLGGDTSGYQIAQDSGHKVTNLYPAMTPLNTKESWTSACTADTIAKATIKVDIPKYKKLKATGDLIFTKSGIRGPVILDFSRELTPIFDKYNEIPILINMTKGKNEDEIIRYLKDANIKNPSASIIKHLQPILPESISKEICNLADVAIDSTYKSITGESKNILIRYLAWTPLTLIKDIDFNTAMVTRGGVSLKDIDQKSMQSKKIANLYFCGEVIDIDGPCGGYNLQWAFSSGYFVASFISNIAYTDT
jgi:predicted Rossmann fold flavoprotein